MTTKATGEMGVLAVNEEVFPYRHLQSENALYTRCGKAVSKAITCVTDWRLSCVQCQQIEKQVKRARPKRDIAGPHFTVHYPSKTPFVKDTWRICILGEGNLQVVVAECFEARDAKRVEDALNDLVWAERLGDR